MLSTVDLESLIAAKRLEIEKEKIILGLLTPVSSGNIQNEKRGMETARPAQHVNFVKKKLCNYNVSVTEEKKDTTEELEGEIPPELDRYIRRYLGLPVMLKAGEYSPNNPLLARERAPGDALLGLGEYERRRNTLRRIRQQQYREYLDQQAKKKQEAKEQAERERREREQKERDEEEREREREREERERERQERERRIRVERQSPERRRASENYVGNIGTFSYSNKVDTGVQVDSVTAPLSVAVQTDDADLFRMASPCKSQITQAERELSPHCGAEAAWAQQDTWKVDKGERRRSYGDFDERSSTLLKKTNRDKLTSDLRHSYMPSIFDADAIQMRNLQAEKEAAARRQFYQQELKNQIMEQQRIREERKTREKMLEQAEMRRLEEQLRMLRAAQDREVDKQYRMDRAMKEDTIEYDKCRKDLQKDIDVEQLKLIRAPHTSTHLPQTKPPPTTRSDTDTKLPRFYSHYPATDTQPERHIRAVDKTEPERNYRLQKHEITKDGNRFLDRNDIVQERVRFPDRTDRTEIDRTDKNSRLSKSEQERKPYSMNIPHDSLFSPNYDVDSYLRKNLNFKDRYEFNRDFDFDSIGRDSVEKNVEKVLVHERPKPKNVSMKPIAKERKNKPESVDSLPIPVLRHSPLSPVDRVETSSNLSDAMKKVDDKWRVPVVQKNILKSIPNEEGKSMSILTQLGSIRRQLQLEQLKLDGISKDDEVKT